MKLEVRIEEGPPVVADSSEEAVVAVGAGPVAYDPDEDPAFQKALRQYLSDQGIDRPFNPDTIAQSKSQTFGLQNPCTNRRGAVLDDCLAERVCTTDGGGEGVYMNVVVRQGEGPSTPWGEPMCVAAAEAEGDEEIVELPTFTLQDFRTLAVAPAASAVQPAPDTLKGMHTNVYAEAQGQQFATELGGFPVQVRAVPVQYAWDYGDGGALGPTELSGAPLEEGAWDVETDTSHVYTETGDYAVTLTTWFYGEYSVAGGPWLPVAGLNDVASAPVPISVWRSTVRNYADDCLQNPQGAGC
ncbi:MULTISPECIES: PKD domain-containing protein [Kocuria]|uniref:PKD domain-containing protein n=1 Tax=Kocuria oceani TaxID=988827 RepID=A0ABV9TNZ2_9MICC|nr:MULTISPECIES: PKD domain-containing protein [Kocuria]